MWTIIMAVIVGFVAGLIARALHPGKDKAGFILTTLLGIGGSLLATYVGRFLGLYPASSSAGFFASIIGAIVILFIYGLISKKSS